jgi:hypothetical protein
LAGVRDRGGTTVTTGPTAVRPAGRTWGTAGTPCEEGGTSRGLGVLDASGGAGHGRLGGPARAGGVRRDAAPKRVGVPVFNCVFPKIFE